MDKVFVVVVTYNGVKWINTCLNSLKESSLLIHTIVIDNGSTDGTQKIVRDTFTDVTLIQAEYNLGFGKANNIGIQEAIRKFGR